MKLVRKDNPSVAIVGTLERIPGMANIELDSFHRDETGNLTWDYAGGTEVYWDGQMTETDENDQTIFVDENGEDVPESNTMLVPDNGSDEDEEEDEEERLNVDSDFKQHCRCPLPSTRPCPSASDSS